MAAKALTMETLNPNLLRLEYDVRGPLVVRAAQIERELQKGAKKPFSKVIKANLGDAHAMGQPPITFIREVLACVSLPQLIERADFPADVKQRARELLAACEGQSVGSYTCSQGIELIRRHVAEYIERRDGHPSNWSDVCLSLGASDAIKNVLQLLCKHIDGKPSGVMIPVPQFPMYSAKLAELGLEPVYYFLDEEQDWALDAGELGRARGQAAASVRAIVVINPGNPTGHVLTRENIEMVIKFARRHKMLILADEVYQENIYDEDRPFHSFKKVLMEMGGEYAREQELASFMSVSKGYAGECGLRGGWVELVNLEPAVQAQLYKSITATLCPSTLGQVAVDCVAQPPWPGSASHARWAAERRGARGALRRRAAAVVSAFNNLPGFHCNAVKGALYAFPRFELPPRALEAARQAGQPPDVFYALQLLEETGVCVIAGSGFGQRAGTYHFRTSLVPPLPVLEDMLARLRRFHLAFLQRYAGEDGEVRWIGNGSN